MKHPRANRMLVTLRSASRYYNVYRDMNANQTARARLVLKIIRVNQLNRAVRTYTVACHQATILCKQLGNSPLMPRSLNRHKRGFALDLAHRLKLFSSTDDFKLVLKLIVCEKERMWHATTLYRVVMGF